MLPPKKGRKETLHYLSEIFNKEKYEVKKVEVLSITELIYELLDSKEQKLDKERQKFISAKLKYDSCKNTISAIEGDTHLLDYNIKIIGDPDLK